MDILFGIVVGIIVLTILVVAHELGHAMVARRFGVVVEEFGIGFPPRAKGWKRRHSLLGKDVEYTLNWLPLGGFVKLQGEHDADRAPGDYGAVTFWQKTLILLMGVGMNLIVAAVLLTILAWMGMPKILPGQFAMPGDTRSTGTDVRVARIVADMPAAAAGLQHDDVVEQIDDVKITTPEQATTWIANHKGRQVQMMLRRGDAAITKQVTLRTTNDDHRGYLGASFSNEERLFSTWSAPIVGVGTTVQFVGATFQGLGDMVSNGVNGLIMKLNPNHATQQQADQKLASAGRGVTGPVGIFGVLFPNATKGGLSAIMMLAAIISVGLAALNVLPIPALDGGRWFVMALYRLRRKPLSAEMEERIHGTGMMVLLALTVIITFGDVGKFFH